MIGVIDIGAHWGEEYESWVNHGAKNFLFIEPIKANYERLLDKFPQYPVLHLALANHTGESKMFVDTAHHNLSASLLKPCLHTEVYPDVLFDKIETVKVDKLDNIEYNRKLYDHVYLTAQGMELDILKGAEKSLKNIKTITAEVFHKRLYEGSCLVEEVVEWLDDRGFDLMGIDVRNPHVWSYANFRRR